MSGYYTIHAIILLKKEKRVCAYFYIHFEVRNKSFSDSYGAPIHYVHYPRKVNCSLLLELK